MSRAALASQKSSGLEAFFSHKRGYWQVHRLMTDT